jgi:hypothetical protein
MTPPEIVGSVQFVVDAEGNKKGVFLEWPVWEELLTLLKELPVNSTQIRAVRGKYASVPTSSEEFARRKQEEIAREN